MPSQKDITTQIEGEVLKNIYLAMSSVSLDIFEFYGYVSAGGCMDYKDPYIWAQAFPNIPYPGENKDYYAFGINISASDLGNLNYGIVGKQFGFKDKLLLWQAGSAQLRDHKNYSFSKSELYSLFSAYYGDQPDDYKMIKIGYDLFSYFGG